MLPVEAALSAGLLVAAIVRKVTLRSHLIQMVADGLGLRRSQIQMVADICGWQIDTAISPKHIYSVANSNKH